MIPLEVRERVIRHPITRRAALLGLALAGGFLMVGACWPTGGIQ